MTTYIYEGPVMEYGRCIANRWEGCTTAPTEKKAISNLKYQFKKETGRIAGTKIDLPAKLKVA